MIFVDPKDPHPYDFGKLTIKDDSAWQQNEDNENMLTKVVFLEDESKDEDSVKHELQIRFTENSTFVFSSTLT